LYIDRIFDVELKITVYRKVMMLTVWICNFLCWN